MGVNPSHARDRIHAVRCGGASGPGVLRGVPRAALYLAGYDPGVTPVGMVPASIVGVSADTRLKVSLVAMLLIVLVTLSATIATIVYAAQPGNAAAVLGVLFVPCIGWGFLQEVGQTLED